MKNILYLHIAKTGGTSVTEALLRHGGYVYPDWIKKHMFMNQALKRCEYHMFKPDITFSVVRNPYSRMQSSFKHFKNNYHLMVVRDSNGNLVPESRSAEEFKMYSSISFKEWMKYILYNRYQYSGLKYASFTQSDYIQNYGAEIYKIEEIHKLEERLGISVAKLNTAPKHYDCEYDDETRGIVSSYFSEDFIRFGYEK
jgi:hypothetical protein